MEYITFALAKGRLAKNAMNLLSKVSITCSEMDEESRKLIFVNEELKFKFFLAKAGDVATYVEHGAADLGVVGKDCLLEEERYLYELLDLKFGACRVVVAGNSESRLNYSKNNHLRVATKYPQIALDYFHKEKRQTVEIIKLGGSVELAPIVGIADVIVDIVETGSTLKENGLFIFDEITEVSARLVANRVSMKLKHDRITQLIKSLQEVI